MCEPPASPAKKPEVIVFAGPNGSGKSTITRMARTAGAYINADDIKRATRCTDLEAAVAAENMRENALARRGLVLLRRAVFRVRRGVLDKMQMYEIRRIARKSP